MPASLPTDIKPIALVEIEGEPRAKDLEIGKGLGLSRPRAIRDLIKRNLTELEAFGAVQRGVKKVRSGKGRESEVEEFFLNEEQALLLAVLSDAENAPAVRAMLIRTFVAWRRGHLVPADGTPVLAITDTKKVYSAFGNIVKNCTGVAIDSRRSAAKSEIAEEVVRQLAPMLANIVPAGNNIVALARPNGSSTVLDLITTHRTLVRLDEAMFDDDGEPKGPGTEESEKVCTFAMNALLAAPCHDFTDVAAKVNYILNGTIGDREPLLDGLIPEGADATDPNGPLVAFLLSLLGVPAEAAQAA